MQINNVGLMGNPLRVMSGLDTVYGYDIAANDFLTALMKWGSFKTINMFYEPNQYQLYAMLRKYRLASKKNPNIEFKSISEYDIIYDKVQTDIDVMHNIGMEFMPQIFYRECCSEKFFPFTYTIHGASYPYYIDSFYLMKLLMPFKNYDSLICTSNAVRDAVENTMARIKESLERNRGINLDYKGRLDVIPLGVDVNEFKPADKREARIEFGIPKDAFVILWVGRFSSYDKADLFPLVVMVKRLAEHNKDINIRFIMAGHDRRDMPLLPKMKEFIRSLGVDNVIQIIENNNVIERNKLFQISDVFVSPADNIQETFGITPIEAMACGIPQVVSDWDGYKDTVEDGVTGYKIPVYWTKCDGDLCESALLPSDPMHRSAFHHLLLSKSVAVDIDAYECAIQKLINNPQLRAEFSKNSVKRAREKYAWNVVIKSYEELWQELIDIKNHTKEEKKGKLLDFLVPSYCDSFNSYPTKYIDDSQEVILTEEGISFINDELPEPIHYEIETTLKENEILKSILQVCNSHTSKRMKLYDAITILGGSYNISIIRRAFMSLLKNGFIRVVS